MKKKILTDKEIEFKKLKRFVQKRAPGARTIIESDGTYSLIDTQGEYVINNSLMLPSAPTIRKAWEYAKYSLWYSNMIQKSNAAFCEEKIYKKLIKESGGE